MTVEELIKELEKWPKHMIVTYRDRYYDVNEGSYEIEHDEEEGVLVLW